MNYDENENITDADTNAIEIETPETRVETVRTEPVEINTKTDLRLRYIVPVVISLLLLILLLTVYAEVPEIISDFSNSLNSKPAFYVKSPEFSDRFQSIIENAPEEIPEINDIPKVPGYNLIGSTPQKVVIEDRLNAVVYSLIYVNADKKEKRLIIHFLGSKNEIVNEFKLYSANRMKDTYRIYRVDESLISLLQHSGRDIVVVQEGTDLDDAEALCRQIFPDFDKPKE